MTVTRSVPTRGDVVRVDCGLEGDLILANYAEKSALPSGHGPEAAMRGASAGAKGRTRLTVFDRMSVTRSVPTRGDVVRVDCGLEGDLILANYAEKSLSPWTRRPSRSTTAIRSSSRAAKASGLDGWRASATGPAACRRAATWCGSIAGWRAT
jgi:hypothetical protein